MQLCVCKCNALAAHETYMFVCVCDFVTEKVQHLNRKVLTQLGRLRKVLLVNALRKYCDFICHLFKFLKDATVYVCV